MKLPRLVVALLEPTAPTLLAALSLDAPYSNIAANLVAQNPLLAPSKSPVADGDQIDPKQVVKIIEQNAFHPDFLSTLREAEASLKSFEIEQRIRFAELGVARLGLVSFKQPSLAPSGSQLPRWSRRIAAGATAIALTCALIILGAFLEHDVDLTSALSASTLLPIVSRTTPWLVAGLLGAVIGFLEIVSRQRRSAANPFSLAPVLSLIYIVTNALAALCALLLALIYKTPPGSALSSTLLSFSDAAIAALASMVFMRSTVFTLRVGASVVPFGPGVVLSTFLLAIEREIDRKSAETRAKRLRFMLRGVTFQAAREILLPGALNFAGISGAGRQELERAIDELAVKRLDDEVKVLNLGLLVWNAIGEAPLRLVITALGSELRGALGTVDAVNDLNRRIEGLLIQPTLVRYVGTVSVEILRADNALLHLIEGTPSFAPSEPGRLEVQFVPGASSRSGQPPESTEMADNAAASDTQIASTASDGRQSEAGPDGTSAPAGRQAVFQTNVRILRGEEKIELLFDVAIDPGGIAFERTRAVCPARTDQPSMRMPFAFTAPAVPGRHELFVEISQFNRLVEVVAVSIAVSSDFAQA